MICIDDPMRLFIKTFAVVLLCCCFVDVLFLSIIIMISTVVLFSVMIVAVDVAPVTALVYALFVLFSFFIF